MSGCARWNLSDCTLTLRSYWDSLPCWADCRLVCVLVSVDFIKWRLPMRSQLILLGLFVLFACLLGVLTASVFAQIESTPPSIVDVKVEPTYVATRLLAYTPTPTVTPYPTYTQYPTNTPYPTYTPYPTNTPYPTYTPYPTKPTVTPYPTNTPYPTYTPPVVEGAGGCQFLPNVQR